MRQKERTGARRRRALLRAESPTRYRQQHESHEARQAALQRLSLRYVRRKWRWTQQEMALLQRMYPAVVTSHEWERLFRTFGRTYVAIRRKISALCRGRGRGLT